MRVQGELEGRLRKAQDYIQQLSTEKSSLNQRASAMEADYVQRLKNACQQRDAANGEVRGPRDALFVQHLN